MTNRDDGARARWQEERTTFQRVYDVLVGTREPATVAGFAERAGCSETGARSALEQLVELGVAERDEGRPVRYRRNDAYFDWRRVEELAREHTPEELRETVEELIDRDEQFQERYGVPDPDAVTEFPDDHGRLHEVWEDLTEWRTVRRDVTLLKRAVQRAESKSGRASA